MVTVGIVPRFAVVRSWISGGDWLDSYTPSRPIAFVSFHAALFSPLPCARLESMKPVLTIAAIITLLLVAGCSPNPTTIVGSVSFLNSTSNYRPFLPAGHSGIISDDVAYVRIVDNGGAGVTIWESPAYSAGAILSPYIGNPTLDTGVYIKSFVITLTDAELAGAAMPLRIESFLYDAAVIAPFPALNPAVDVGRYSTFDAIGNGDPGWRIQLTILPNEIKTVHLDTRVPF